ncbi:putative inorganic carbon transporter subunit DabA [Methylomarinum vadi]|uniref:putative inorganic carbon transporter subunit DabA n=1 Tax=Methylomarinum vadi TaxID=438855 RepID=UPI0004DF7AA9|nr:putative inorganic carbon transporter subunit DabA [Methylomarinum vadi]
MNSATPLLHLQKNHVGLNKDRVDQPTPELKRAIKQACRRIAPLWPLQHFVAVNPFLGLTDLDFNKACTTMHRVAHGDMVMSAQFYAEQFSKRRLNNHPLKRVGSNNGLKVRIRVD